jgi:hypothetical protein
MEYKTLWTPINILLLVLFLVVLFMVLKGRSSKYSDEVCKAEYMKQPTCMKAILPLKPIDAFRCQQAIGKCMDDMSNVAPAASYFSLVGGNLSPATISSNATPIAASAASSTGMTPAAASSTGMTPAAASSKDKTPAATKSKDKTPAATKSKDKTATVAQIVTGASTSGTSSFVCDASTVDMSCPGSKKTCRRTTQNGVTIYKCT